MKLVVAIGGASGAPYAKRLLDVLRDLEAGSVPGGLEIATVFSDAGKQVWAHEVGTDPRELPFRRYGGRDFGAPFASGSAGWDAMIVIPCSMGGLARIAHGISGDLIGRAADVMLKERRRLILVVRETPYSLLHLENMERVTRAGAIVMPASPSFYARPQSVEGLLDTVISRALDHLRIPNQLHKRWGAEPQEE
ncbi:MAG TPA: UbiX family flavin prenyltransferase [Polyangia bacterium]|nr:UbiX family flavin prenyltransferase [Polyangia bacterium]